MSEHEFGAELLDTDRIERGAKSYLISSGGKIIAILTLVISVLITFTDVTLSGDISYSLMTTLVAMLIASYLMFFSLEDAGERLGEESEGYRTALERYRTARARIGADMIPRLRDFCTRYSKNELEYRRLTLLTEHGYTKDDYIRYKETGECEISRCKRIFKRYERMSSAALTPQVLLSPDSERRECELIDPQKYKLLSLILRLIPSTLCMIFTVSVILSTKDGMSADFVLDGLFKLSALPIVGLRGYSEGYSYVKNRKSAWLETKSRIIEAFLSEAE